MSEKKSLTVLAIIITLGIQAAASATAFAQDNGRNSGKERGGWVMPCSLVGVNPVYHPEIFGSPAVAARDYGFVRSPDGTWHVGAGCGAPASASAASAYAPRPESQKAIRQRRR